MLLATVQLEKLTKTNAVPGGARGETRPTEDNSTRDQRLRVGSLRGLGYPRSAGVQARLVMMCPNVVSKVLLREASAAHEEGREASTFVKIDSSDLGGTCLWEGLPGPRRRNRGKQPNSNPNEPIAVSGPRGGNLKLTKTPNDCAKAEMHPATTELGCSLKVDPELEEPNALGLSNPSSPAESGSGSGGNTKTISKEEEGEEAKPNSKKTDNDRSGTVEQTGTENYASLLQTGAWDNVQQYDATIRQDGTGNSAIVTQGP